MKKSVLLLVIPVVLVVVLVIVFVSGKANSPGKSEESILTVFSETYENIIDINFFMYLYFFIELFYKLRQSVKERILTYWSCLHVPVFNFV